MGANRSHGFRYLEKRPEDIKDDGVISKTLEGVGIVLMDYNLHDNDDGSGVPIDGLELLERFRATIRRHSKEGRAVPLLTIYTAELDQLARQHDDCPAIPFMLARRANVDWIFEKKSPSANEDPFGNWLQECLDALDCDLSETGDSVEEQLVAFLRLPPDTGWSELALEQVIDSRPPIQAVERKSARAFLVRWLLQIALPFPGCFVDLDTVAVRLRMHPASLRAALDEFPDSEFARQLGEREYNGPLASFFPKRYWKAGVDHLIWQATQGRAPNVPAVRDSLNAMIGKEVSMLTESNPVLVVSPETFLPTGEIAELSDAVQVQSDLWPMTVEPPWVRVEEVRHDRTLRSMVVSKDKDRIDEDVS